MMGMIGLFHHSSQETAHAALSQGLRADSSGVGPPAEQPSTELTGHGIQLANDQRKGWSGHDAHDC